MRKQLSIPLRIFVLQQLLPILVLVIFSISIGDLSSPFMIIIVALALLLLIRILFYIIAVRNVAVDNSNLYYTQNNLDRSISIRNITKVSTRFPLIKISYLDENGMPNKIKFLPKKTFTNMAYSKEVYEFLIEMKRLGK